MISSCVQGCSSHWKAPSVLRRVAWTCCCGPCRVFPPSTETAKPSSSVPFISSSAATSCLTKLSDDPESRRARAVVCRPAYSSTTGRVMNNTVLHRTTCAVCAAPLLALRTNEVSLGLLPLVVPGRACCDW